jgi:hypothetical protein
MMLRADRLTRPGVVLAAIVAALLLAAGAARADYSVEVNAAANDPADGCGLFSLGGNPSPFLVTPPCGSGVLFGNALGFAFWAGGSVPAGTKVTMQVNAPPGISIIRAVVSPATISNVNSGGGWGGGSYFAGGGNLWHSGDTSELDQGFSSSYWGFNIVCGWATCRNGSDIYLDNVVFTASEPTGPSVAALGADNLWFEGGRYVWNPPGDSWPISFAASDPSGVCSMSATVNGTPIPGPASTPDTSAWQQCPNQAWTTADGAEVDTRDFVPTAGPLALTLTATNAAQVASSPSGTLQVDNDPVRVALSSPDDPNPTLWVNHAVTVDATTTAGPSGVGGTNCSVDGGQVQPYTTAGVAVSGNGIHTVSCTGWNRAVDPQGAPATGSSSITVKIDEVPPSVSFEPQVPGDETALAVDTADAESGVAGGSIEMAPEGADDWTSLPTTFDGSHLLATIDDAGRSGPYVFRATACDNVGNCASTEEALTLPVRMQDTADVSFGPIAAPAKIVRERVRVDWHWRRERRHRHWARVRTGGHLRTLRIVITQGQRCGQRRVRTGPHRWKELTACRTPTIRLIEHRRVAFGRRVTVHGLLASVQGAPIADAAVEILTAPVSSPTRWHAMTTVTTAADGTWTATLRAGPSRIIRAVYAGTGALLPVSDQVTVSVPARIRLAAAPASVAWGQDVVLSGRLVGGYVPRDGVALRLLVRYPGSPQASVLAAFRTTRHGAFRFAWRFVSGRGVATYPFWVATTASETDYPFAASSSRRLKLTFGRSA